MTAPLLDINQLRVHFGPHPAVDGLSVSLKRGQTLALVGESGCGKSTTALALMGLLPASARVSGRVLFDGRDLLELEPAQWRTLRGRHLGIIFQEPMTSLNPALTIGYQVVEVLRLHGLADRKLAHARALELLDQVEIPQAAQRFGAYPHQLSGGQRQRVVIAMAIACNPQLLIADEPTAALDVTVARQVLQLLDRLQREHAMAMLLITHDLALVENHADHCVVMHGGQAMEHGSASAVLESPRHPYTKGLLGASLHRLGGIGYREQRLPEVRISSATAGQPARFELHRPAPLPALATRAAQPPLLKVRDLVSGYEGKPAVHGVSFDLLRGQTLGLVGESGCGKSTLSRTLTRLILPMKGSIEFAGAPLGDATVRGPSPIQMVFQDPYTSLNPRCRVGDILERVLIVSGVRQASERRRAIAERLDQVGLSQASVQRYPHEFSGGQRQRIGIARALLTRPQLLILDEPVSALDVSVQAQILNLLVELKHSLNLSYLFISHDLAVIRYMADEVLVMQHGRIVEAANAKQLWGAPSHPYTRTLLSASHEPSPPATSSVLAGGLMH
jgi:peptide/nickel transport system ATP-binding protein